MLVYRWSSMLFCGDYWHGVLVGGSCWHSLVFCGDYWHGMLVYRWSSMLFCGYYLHGMLVYRWSSMLVRCWHSLLVGVRCCMLV